MNRILFPLPLYHSNLPATQGKSFSISNSLWATSYQANDPCEDRHCSLTNVLLQDRHRYSSDEEESAQTDTSTETSTETGTETSTGTSKTNTRKGTLRMSLFAVLDGHGGPAVAEYASKCILPMLARNISSSIQCDIVEPGLFQVNGRTRRLKDDASDNHDDGDDHSDDNDDDDASLSSNDSTTSSTASGIDHDDDYYHEKNWYSAPEHNDVLQLPASMNSSPQIFHPGLHSVQEQNIISKTIQKTFLDLDEAWMNSIHPNESRQSYLVHNGKWNSGACCLVNVILQRMPYSLDDGYDDNNGGDTDNASTGGNESESSDHKAMLYSSHTGDCRAVLLSGKDVCHETKNEESSSQSDDLSFHSDDSDNDAENDFKCINRDEDDGNSRKRMLLNPFQANLRSFKRGRIWNQVDEGFNHGYGNKCGITSMSMEDSEWEKVEMRLETRKKHYDNQDLDRIPGQSQRHARLPPRSCSPSPGAQIKPYPKEFVATTLTEDHTPYNQKEVSLVRERCKYAARAIATSTSGGIQRVAGSLSVTRALGDAYLKTPTLSFAPYKAHAPYISALPEVSARILTPNDRILVLASDGVWERVNEAKVAQWTGEFFRQRNGPFKTESAKSSSPLASDEGVRMRRMRMLPTRKSLSRLEQETVNARILNMTHVSDMIVAKVLNKARQKHKIPSLRALMEVPKGHSRRTKHDDITTIVVDLDGFTH